MADLFYIIYKLGHTKIPTFFFIGERKNRDD